LRRDLNEQAQIVSIAAGRVAVCGITAARPNCREIGAGTGVSDAAAGVGRRSGPKNPDVLLLPSLGRANFEVAYRGKVLLLDAYYDNSRLTFGERFGVK
jgi:hypothetical protein